MIALLDTDIFCYRVAAVCEAETKETAEARLTESLHQVMHDVGATEYEAYLTGQDNFRKFIYPEYKANRKDIPKPKWLEHLREFLVVHWKATISSGVEADDEIGITATRYFKGDVPFVIVSNDKDLKQLAGKHYDFTKGIFDFITPLDGTKQFYRQMLIGDRSDNVRGVEGIGEKKAGRAIDPLETEEDMYDVVYNLYSDKQRFLINSQLLWILKHRNDPSEILRHYHSLQKHAEGMTLLSSDTFPDPLDLGLAVTNQRETHTYP